MRPAFPASLIEALRQNLSADAHNAIVQIDQHLSYVLAPAVGNKLITARCDLQLAQSTVDAAIAVAEMEVS